MAARPADRRELNQLYRYYHRTADDAQGLTFKRWEAKKGEILVLNSSELRAVQGHQKNDFILNPINPPKQRAQTSRAAKVYPQNKSGPWTLRWTWTLGRYARPREWYVCNVLGHVNFFFSSKSALFSSKFSSGPAAPEPPCSGLFPDPPCTLLPGWP